MKKNQLVVLFTRLSGSGRIIRFGDLMRKGFDSAHILLALKEVDAELDSEEEGYTVIHFR